MPTGSLVNAFVSLALMVAVMTAYLLLGRRFRVLWHPLAVVLAVGVVGVTVSVLGEVLFRGTSGVPGMLQRSAIGSFGWGVVIAFAVWIARRVFLWFSGTAPAVRAPDPPAR